MSIGKIKEFNVNDKNWDTYIARLNNYFIANGVKSELKVPTLLTVIGDDTYELITNLVNPEVPEEISYDDLVKLVKNHVNPEPNFIVGRFKFRQRLQNEKESIANFAADLKKLAKFCDFKTTLNDNLRDQLLFGLRNEYIKQKLFSIKKLSYTQAYEIATTMESAESNAHQTTSTETTTVHRIRPGHSHESRRRRSHGKATDEPCQCCGRSNHPTKSCFYKNSVCDLCGKRGHLKYVCKLNKVNNNSQSDKKINRKFHSKNYMQNSEISDDESETNSNYVTYSINDRVESNKPIKIELKINDRVHKMELDTGSAFAVISESYYKKYWKNEILYDTNKTFKYYSGEIVQPIGYIKVRVEYKSIKEILKLYVITNGGPPLIGRDWIFKLKILDNELASNTTYNINCKSKDNVVRELMEIFPEVFNKKLGKFNKFKAKLHLKDNVQPVFLKARPLPYALRDRVEAELDKLVSDGILQPVDYSEFATPIVPVLKKNGEIRICGDFKVTVNPNLKIDKFPIPRVDDLFSKLHGGKHFSKIDLSQAYAQIELDDGSKAIVTINTYKGLFQFNRLPYGVASAPSIFQRTMEQIFGNIPGCGVFIDDIVVTGKDEKTHKENLIKVFTKLSECGLTIKSEKCKFYQKSISYLGYIIDEFGLHPNQERVEAIVKINHPNNVTEVKAFLGLVGYYAKFIKNLSSILHPLYKLLQKNAPFVWSRECQNAFNEIKDKLKNAKWLAHYDINLPITLTCDASSYGLGAVISHVYPNGESKPIAYASRTMLKNEMNYSQIQKEALAIIFGVKKFHQYLYGKSFTLFTDHKPLIAIFGQKKGIPLMAANRLQRWALILSGYDYVIKYIKSSDNVQADSLSRLPLYCKQTQSVDFGHILYIQDNLPLTFKKIEIETSHDIILSKVYSYLNNGWPSKNSIDKNLKPFYDRRNELHIDHGCILWGYRIVVPKRFQNFLLKEIHSSHLGINKCKSLARSYVWWPHIDRDIENICQNCSSCRLEQPSPQRSMLHPWIGANKPWSRLHLDFLGPIQNTKYLVIKDGFTRWIEVFPMKNTNASSTIKILQRLFSQFGLPRQIVSDNGPPFASKELSNFCKSLGIKQTFAPPFHPRSNGSAENAVKVIKKCIKKAIHENVDVETAICKFLMDYRNSTNSVTGTCPAQLLLGRKLNSRFDLLIPKTNDIISNHQENQIQNFNGKDRTFEKNVLVRDYKNPAKPTWVEGEIIRKVGEVMYDVNVGNQVWRRHSDQMRKSTSNEVPIDTEPHSDIFNEADTIQNNSQNIESTSTIEPIPSTSNNSSSEPRYNLRPRK